MQHQCLRPLSRAPSCRTLLFPCRSCHTPGGGGREVYLSCELGKGLGAEEESSEVSLREREEVDKDFSSKSCLDGGWGTLVLPKTVVGDTAQTRLHGH